MKIEIKNRLNGKIILCGDYEGIRDCLEKNRDANLTDANLRDEKLDKKPMQIIGLRYFILITKEQIKIGCENHKVADWKEFNNKRIIEMDGKEALVWWETHKKLIFNAHEIHCK